VKKQPRVEKRAPIFLINRNLQATLQRERVNCQCAVVMPGTQSSLRRLRKLVCAAGHPRLAFLGHERRGCRAKRGHDGVRFDVILLSSSAKDRMARELGRLAAAARANISANRFYFARV